ncbi:hypothetical protein [Streptomyces canus]|uniref:hypothetical protein n=1 Tax=Streptomyces canus TaxID=58343 RepID=UPI00324A3795
MHVRRIGTVLSAVASTGRVAVNGCISAQRGKEGPISTREITAYVKARNTGPRRSSGSSTVVTG